MKKFLAMILTVVMVVSLAACGLGGAKDGKDDKPGTEQTVANKDDKAQNDLVADSKNDAKDDAKADTDVEDAKAGADVDAGNDEADAGAEDADGWDAVGDPLNWLSTKTGKFYSQFLDGEIYMEYESELDGAWESITMAMKDGKIYLNTEMQGEEVSFILKSGESYIIQHSAKIAMKMDVETDSFGFDEAIIREKDVNMGNIKKGTYEIDGKTYETEYWEEVDGTSEIICFEGDTPVYIINNAGESSETIVKIIKMTNKVDDKLFEIPEGYTIF